jgi:RHS repeat-associated protein
MRRLAAVALLVLVFAQLPVARLPAQVRGGGVQPNCQSGCGGGGPSAPVITWLEPTGAGIYADTVYTASPTLQVDFCDNNEDGELIDRYIALNETNVTSSFSYDYVDDACWGGHMRSTATSLSLSLGWNTLYAYICNSPSPCNEQTIGVYYATPAAPMIALHNLNSDNQDRSLCLTVGAGQAAGLSCGDLFVVHGMPAYRTMGRDRSLTLLYSSAAAAPRPVVAVTVHEPDTTATPNAVFARLTVSGVAVDSATYYGFGSATKQIVLGYDASGVASGIYPFRVTVRNLYDGGPHDDSTSGEFLVVNRSTSEFGAGWWLAGVEQLVLGQSNNRILWIGGDGSAAVYDSVAAHTWVRHAGPYRDTLAYAASVYTLTLRHGVRVSFDGQGRHIQTTNRAGQSTAFTWSGNPVRLTAIQVPPAGISAIYTLAWNGSTHLLDSLMDPAGRTLGATMSSGTITQLVDADGRTTGFQYDGSQRLTRRTNPRGYGTAYVYGNGLHVTRIAIPLNPAASDSARDSSRTTIEWWDEKGLAIGSPGGTLSAIDTASTYTRVYGPRISVADNATFWVDRWGAPVQVVGAVYDTTIITRSTTTGLVTMVRNPVGDSVTAIYTARGNDSTVTDHTHEGGGSVAPVTTSYVYGDANTPDGPTSIRTPVDTAIFQYHTSLGVPILVTRQGGGRTGFSYDSMTGLLLTVTEYGARVVDTTTWTRTNANLVTTFAYDAAGNDTSVTAPSGRRTRNVRDSYQRVAQVYDPAGHRTDHAYDLMNRDTAITVWDGSAFTTRVVYSATGHDSIVEDPRHVRREWRYDAADRDTAMFDEASVSESHYYNSDGAMDSLRTRTGHVIKYRYDAAGRLVATLFPAFANYVSFGLDATIPADSIIRQYDAGGRLTSAKLSGLAIVRTYNREGTLRSERQQLWSGGSLVRDDTVRYWTDGGDRRTRFYNAVDTLRYSYGSDGHLSSIAVQWQTGQPSDTFLLFWDSLGRRDSLVYRRINLHISYGYDADGRQRMVWARHVGSSFVDDILEHKYVISTVNADGMPVAWHESSGVGFQHSAIDTNVQYDARHRMLRDGSGQSVYAYDGSGNRVARHWVSNNVLEDSLTYAANSNRVSQRLGDGNGGTGPIANYGLDANGSLRYEVHNYTQGYVGTRLYYYNSLGQVTGMQHAYAKAYNQYTDGWDPLWEGGSNECRYDPLGRRVVACDFGGALVYDGDNAVGMIGNWRYVHGPGTDDPLVGLEYIGGFNPYRKFYYLTDGAGRQLAFADSLGNDQAALYYSSGGSQAGGITASQTFANGRSETPQAPELSFYRNRYYDQRTGRWTQEDPTGVAGGLNLYQYAGNNPAASTDPFGLGPDTVHIVGSDAFKEQIQHERDSNARFAATYDAMDRSTRSFYVVEGESVPGGCEGSGVFALRDLNYCAAPGNSFPASGRGQPVTPAMEQLVGAGITGALILYNYANPMYARSAGDQVWHEMTHALGIVDGHGGSYERHTDAVWCGVPGSQATCPRQH